MGFIGWVVLVLVILLSISIIINVVLFFKQRASKEAVVKEGNYALKEKIKNQSKLKKRIKEIRSEKDKSGSIIDNADRTDRMYNINTGKN